MSNMNDQLGRMKSMMNYGLQTENKKDNYCNVEYHSEGADGKSYGIVREGTKFYIKVSPKKNQLIKEDFEYIGGFRNRKDNEYSSYANALKNYDLKMMSLREHHKTDGIIVESWNPDKQEFLALESTSKMQREIQRQRQIMGNASLISEKKSYNATLMEEKPKGVNTNSDNDPFQEKSGNKDAVKTQKNNIGSCKDEAPKGGKTKDDCTLAKVEGSVACQTPKGGKVVKESEVLGWNSNADYLDTAKGTNVGDTAPFNIKVGKSNAPTTKQEGSEDTEETVNETVMHQEGENQNSPKVGVGEIGDTAPYNKKVNEEEEDEETLEEAISDFGSEEEDEFGGEEENDMPFGDDDFSSLEDGEVGMEDEDSAIDSRITSIEDMLAKIAEKLGVSEPMDGEVMGDESMVNDDLYGDEETSEFEEPIEDNRFYESRKHKIAMLEDRLDSFGKHPAYQKKVMELPPANQKEKEGYYDMNDDSVKSEQPYGSKIGDTAPFDINPKDIENAITESLKRLLKKKK